MTKKILISSKVLQHIKVISNIRQNRIGQISPVAPASEIPFPILPRGSVFTILSFN